MKWIEHKDTTQIPVGEHRKFSPKMLPLGEPDNYNEIWLHDQLHRRLETYSVSLDSVVVHVLYKDNKFGMCAVYEDDGHIQIFEADWEKLGLLGKLDPWDDANYYSVGDSDEYLTHECVEEALNAHLDLHYSDEIPLQEILEDICPIEIFAWRRKKVSRNWSKDIIERFIDDVREADMISENWWEEYGDIDGDNPPLCKAEKEDIKRLTERLTDTFHAYMVKYSHVWQCEVSAKREYTEEMVREFIKVQNPEWLEAEHVEKEG